MPRGQLLALARALRQDLHFHGFVYCAAAHFPEEGTAGAEDHLPDRTLVAYRVRRLPDPATLLEQFSVPPGWTVDVDPVSLL